MNVYKYAALYEDKAHKTFVACVIPQITLNHNLNIQIEEVPHCRIRASNKSEVDKYCASASREAFVLHNADFFVVCRDTDSIDSNVWKQKQNELSGKLHHIGNSKTVLCLPVQCIEHWLLYLKYHRENPALTKNENIEHVPRKDAKVEVYGRLKPGEDRCTSVVQDYCKDMNVGWLESRSKSFLAFSTNVRTVLQHIGAS